MIHRRLLLLLMPFVLVAATSCGSGGKASDPEQLAIQLTPFQADSAILADVSGATVCDTLLCFRDNQANEAFYLLYSYPSLRFLGQFPRKGKGPAEMVMTSGLHFASDSVRVMGFPEAQMFVYATADLVKGNALPARAVRCDEACDWASGLCEVTDGYIRVRSVPESGRIVRIDREGRLLGICIFENPQGESKSQGSLGLWNSVADADGTTVALATTLGEVLDVYDLSDTTVHFRYVGPDGEPQWGDSGGALSQGTRFGYQRVRILDDRIYALYWGQPFNELNGVARKMTLQIFDRTAKLLAVCTFDRYVDDFAVLPDGRTVLAIDRSAESPLFTFTLPEL